MTNLEFLLLASIAPLYALGFAAVMLRVARRDRRRLDRSDVRSKPAE